MNGEPISEITKLFYSKEGLYRLSLLCFNSCQGRLTIRGMYNKLYRAMKRGYRTEDFFKQVVFDEHINYCLDPFQEVAFSEFQVGECIADLLFCNGAITIYEIKTGLDSLERLDNQIASYSKVASEIWVVCDDRFVDTLLSRYGHSSIGIARIDEKGVYTPVKTAYRDCSRLSSEALMSLLHKNELQSVCAEMGIHIDDNCLFGKRAREKLVSCLSPEQAEVIVRDNLKKRKKINVGFDKLPNSVQFLAYTLSNKDYRSFLSLLPRKYAGGSFHE